MDLRADASNLQLAKREAAKQVSEHRQRVQMWMDAEARALRLRFNSNCPFWPAYIAAERALAKLNEASNG